MESQLLSIRCIFTFLVISFSSGAWAQNNATGAVVTYSGTDGVYSDVFSVDCTACHSPVGGSPADSVFDGSSPDLTSYSAASANSALNAATMPLAIQLRVVTNQDMPPAYNGGGGGDVTYTVNSTQRNLVNDWVNDGAQQIAAPTYASSSVDDSGVGKYSATLSANIYENGANASYQFTYWEVSGGSVDDNSTSLTLTTGGFTGGGNTSTAISESISGLNCGTQYFYRANASNSAGNNFSHTSSYPSFTTDPCNVQPVISSSAPTTATEEVQYSYQVTVTDSDDSSWTYSLSGEPAGMTISSAGLITWTPAEGVTTSGSVTVSAFDGGEDGVSAATQSFTIAVTAVNDPPTLTADSATLAVVEGSSLTNVDNLTLVDVDGPSASYSLTVAPSGLSISASTGAISWTPGDDELASNPVTVQVSDGEFTDTASFTVNVTLVNDPPVITSSPPASAVESSLYSYQILASDPDDSTAELTFSGLNTPTGMTVSPTGLVTWTPGNGVTTSGEVTFRVADGGENGAAAATQSVTISVTGVNTPPSITTTAPTTATEDTLYSYTVGVIDADDTNNGTDISFTLSNAPTGMIVSDTGLIEWTPAEGVLSSGAVTLTVADGGENGVSAAVENFTITVTAVNDAPIITSSAPTTATEDTLYSYIVAVDDPDDTSLVDDLNFSLTNEPTGMTISTLGVITWTPVEGVLSSGAVTVTVTDGGEDGAAAAVENFTVAVTAVNDAPVLAAIADSSITEGDTFSLTASATDSDSASLTYALTTAPTGMTIDDTTGEISWTPGDDPSAVNDVTVVVSDDGSPIQQTSESFVVNVTPVNDAPIISSAASTTAVEGFLYSYTVVVTDPDDANNGTDLSFVLSGAPDASMELSPVGLLTWTPPEGVTSSGEITVTVSDGGEDGALAATQAFTISVEAFNSPPSIISTAPAAATEDVLYSYQVDVADVDDINNGSDITFSLTNAPEGMSISPTGLLTWTPLEGVLSSGSFTISAADGGENNQPAATEAVSISVTPVNDAPVISSTAPTSVVEGNLLSYQVLVVDPDDINDGTQLAFELLGAPADMTLSPTGLLAWTPAEGTTSSGEFTIRVSDGGEDGSVPSEQVLTVGVVAFNSPPVITSVPVTQATEDVPYSYQVLVNDIDDANNGEDLTFTLSSEQEGLAISPTGLLTWTPQNGDFNSGLLTITVADGGEDAAQPAQQSFTISVTPVNDAPTITSIAPTVAAAGVPFSYQLEVSDPDDLNNGVDLMFNVSNAPAGMSISTTGLLTWSPNANSPSNVAAVVTVNDGGEDGAQPAMQTVSLSVEFDVDGDQIANEVDNCFDVANANQLDTDGDGLGDACDDDDDADSIPDEVELANGLDPLNPDDADEDADGDGRSNAEEFEQGGNIQADDVAPVVTAPRSIVVPSTGLLTRIDLGSAVATDSLAGPVSPTNSASSDLFQPGRYVIDWRAEDGQGNTGSATQVIEVLPVISMSRGQVSGEGHTMMLSLRLNGDAPNDNASVAYTVSGTATASDHTLVPGRVPFINGLATIVFDIIQDNLDEVDETLVINLASPTDSVLGEIRSHTITIVAENLPPTVDLAFTQSANSGLILTQSGGLVTVQALASDPNGDTLLAYDWSQTQSELLDIATANDGVLTFNPTGLTPGFYEVVARVSDLRLTTRVDALVEVTPNAAARDNDEDGIDDAEDMFDQSFALQLDAAGSGYIETEAHLKIALGKTTRRLAAFADAVTPQDLANLAAEQDASSSLPSGTALSTIFDFSVAGLSSVGESVRVVLPLSSPLLANSAYHKYGQGQWRSFIEDDANLLESAALINDICPGPNSDEYTLGLTEGDQCVRLTIQDGGPNDADGFANAVVEDPGVFVGTGQTASSGGSGSGGSGSGGGNGGSLSSGGGGVMDRGLLLLLFGLFAAMYLRKHARSRV